MLNLCRNQAPVSSAAWAEIDAEAKRVLQLHLAGRKLVDFDGPHGWGFSAVPLGRTDALKSSKGIQLGKRRLQPLVELRGPFTLARAESEAIDRGAQDADLAALVEATTVVLLAAVPQTPAPVGRAAWSAPTPSLWDLAAGKASTPPAMMVTRRSSACVTSWTGRLCGPPPSTARWL